MKFIQVFIPYFFFHIKLNCICIDSVHFVMLLELGEEAVAGLLGVAEQHGGVGVEEDGVVHRCVSNAQRPLHNNDLKKKREFGLNFLFYIVIERLFGLTKNHLGICDTKKSYTNGLTVSGAQNPFSCTY